MGELFGDTESLPLKTLPVEVPPNMGELRCSESANDGLDAYVQSAKLIAIQVTP